VLLKSRNGGDQAKTEDTSYTQRESVTATQSYTRGG